MLTKKGYNRIWDKKTKRLKMEHNLVWEERNGPIPKGMVIHHINQIKTDNRIENLQCVTALDHKRIHSGCILRKDGAYKPCGDCHEYKLIKEFYKTKQGWLHAECKKCSVIRTSKSRKIRKQKMA